MLSLKSVSSIAGVVVACMAARNVLEAQQAPAPVNITVLAHYVSWHDQGNPAWETASILPYRRGSGVGEAYDSDDREIIRQHNEDFIKYGLTPLASWAGRATETNAGDVFFDAYLSVPSPVKMAVLYEVIPLLEEAAGPSPQSYDFGKPAIADKFVVDIEHLHAKYFTRHPERFLKIDGRPVVFIWLSQAFTGPFDTVAARVRDKAYLIGSEFSPYPPMDRNLERLSIYRGLDAISAYGIQYDAFHKGRLDARYVGQLVSTAVLWAEWLDRHVPGTVVIPPIAGRNPNGYVFVSSEAEARYAAGAYRELVEEAYLGCRKSILPMVLIVSYNEHYEGTSLEAWFRNQAIPRPFEFDAGSMYLNVVRDVFSPPIAYAPVSCP